MGCTSTYAFGECTWGVAQMVSWLPCGLGNAIDWCTSARRLGLPTSMTPKAGAVVVYGPCCSNAYLYSSDGHCALVTSVVAGGQFWVKEMNFYGDGGGYNLYDNRLSSMEAVECFIYPPGTTSKPPTPKPPPPPAPKVSGGRLAALGAVLLGGAAVVLYELERHPDERHRLEADLGQVETKVGSTATGAARGVGGWLQSL